MNPSSLSRALASRQNTDGHTGEHPRGLELDIKVDEANAKRCVATLTLCDVRSAARMISSRSR